MPASPGSSSFFNLIVDHGGIQGLTDDDHPQYPFFSTGTGTPVGAVTPQRVGHIYIDTSGENAWIATNTTNADWEQIDAAGGGGGGPSVSTGAGTPSTTPSAEGDIYIDTTNDVSYMAVGTASSSDWKQTSNLPQGITSVSDDTTPQLGGDLDAQSNSISAVADLEINESADHTTTPAAGKGIFWVRNDTPCTPVFTDDAGTDHVLNAAGGGTDVSILSVEKNTAGTINKGQVVYIAGYDTDKPTVELADADASAALPPIGVANASITDSTAGDVVMSGIVDGMDTSAFTAGDNVYLDTTAGALVATRPDEEFVYRIGQVIYSHASNGILRVNIERVWGRYWIYGVIFGLTTGQRLDNWFPSQATGTVESVEIGPAKFMSGADASNYWTFDIQNVSESDRSILASPYDMTTDPTWKSWVDLGAVSGTAANLEVTRGDLINLEVSETGSAPSLGDHSISVRIKVRPAN